MIPLVAYERELELMRELVERVADEHDYRDYLLGTMIELPRACFQADRIARDADFFSFGTNDLTQTALGFSRDDIEGRVLARYIDVRVLDRSPFETLDTPGVGQMVVWGACLGVACGRPETRGLRRARRRPRLDRLPERLGNRLTCPARPTACRSRASRPHKRRRARRNCPARPSLGARQAGGLARRSQVVETPGSAKQLPRRGASGRRGSNKWAPALTLPFTLPFFFFYFVSSIISPTHHISCRPRPQYILYIALNNSHDAI